MPVLNIVLDFNAAFLYLQRPLYYMKDYFLKLLSYDRHTNLQILDAIIAANKPEKAVQTMAHLLAAQQIWLSRCEGRPATNIPLWPNWEVVQFKYLIEENSANWAAYLNKLKEKDFDNIIAYQSLKGDPFINQLTDILSHLFNHGTHHRAQIGQYLKQAGTAQLPITDYIFYIREQNQ